MILWKQKLLKRILPIQALRIWAKLLLINCLSATPWLTGPLIAPVGEVLPQGQFLIRSYLYAGSYKSPYTENWRPIQQNKNLLSTQLEWQGYFGLTPWADFEITPRFILNGSHGTYYFFPGDLEMGLGFKMCKGVKFTVKEIFPTGSYQRLKPIKRSTDITGNGAFGTQLGLVFYKLIELSPSRFVSLTFTSLYTMNLPFQVHGFNSYGGGFGTNGELIPGNQFEGTASFELSLSQRWAFALDAVYQYTHHTSFLGQNGIGLDGKWAKTGGPFADQWSLAPAIEYHWSPSLGLIAGCWLSVGGRNSASFASSVANIQFTY